MNLLFKANRKMRRGIYSRLSESILNMTLPQKILGYVKQDDSVVDRMPYCYIEYNYNSDIGRNLFFNGSFEEKEIGFFSKKLLSEEKPLIIDVGANIGLHSIIWGKLMPGCKIYAFEPSPDTSEVLERNIRRNFLSGNIVLIPKAVSDREGTATFYQCDDNAYSSLKDTKRKSIINTVQVPVTTVDRFIEEQGIKNISLIKIDVEGFEKEVVSGALDTMKKFKPDLFVEIFGGDSSNEDPEGTVELIASCGYKPYILVDGNPVPYVKHNDSNYNYYFTAK